MLIWLKKVEYYKSIKFLQIYIKMDKKLYRLVMLILSQKSDFDIWCSNL